MDDTLNLQDSRPADLPSLLEALKDAAGSRGYHRVLDAQHTATLVARGSTLLVSFEETDTTLARDSGLPVALDLAEDKNWSVLHLTADAPTWFRSQGVFDFFDELADDVFFDEYDRVVFHGADAGGYAAAAYSVTAPGARVVAVSPQATLDTRMTPWDTRHPHARRIGFTGRYAYAPEMIVAAEDVAILYDPARAVDAMHATLFQGSNVTPIRAWHIADAEGTPLVRTLEDLDLLHPMIEALGRGRMNRARAYSLLRARHDNLGWLRRVVQRAVGRGQPRLIALACKAAIKRGGGQMFRRRLQAATDQMSERGERPDWLDDTA